MKKNITEMKVIHTSFFANVGGGILAQLKSEENVVHELKLGWDILLVSSQKKKLYKESFFHQIPYLMSINYFLKRLYYHYILQKRIKKEKYNIILYRYLKADIFSYIFRGKYKNRITVHHTKETNELALGNSIFNKFLQSIESYYGHRFIAGAKGLVAMTQEIAIYEIKRSGKEIPYIVIPNGVDLNSISLVDDKRTSELNIAFIAGSFLPWHGLDLLLQAIEKSDLKFTLHLIGNIPLEIREQILTTDILNSRINVCGYLNRKERISILSKCNIGIDSLALNRKGMSEACALKVREYLASGIPVYSGFKDAGLPASFPFYKIGEVDINSIANYARSLKKVSRQEVRDRSKEYIDKVILTKRLYEFLNLMYIDSREM